jgi:hypothetical protein
MIGIEGPAEVPHNAEFLTIASTRKHVLLYKKNCLKFYVDQTYLKETFILIISSTPDVVVSYIGK